MAPDGRRIAYASEDVDFDLVAISEDGRRQQKRSRQGATNSIPRGLQTVTSSRLSPTEAVLSRSGREVATDNGNARS